MNKNVVITALIIFSILIVVVLANFMPAMILLVPLALIAVSSVFFSRGILIFLTMLCLTFTQSPFGVIRTAAMQLRWVFFTLFALHVFGDIFLGRTVRKIKSFDFLVMIFVIYAFFSFTYSAFPTLTLERAATVLILYISVFWIIWKYSYEQGPEKIVYLMLNVIRLIFSISFLMILIAPHRVFFSGRFQGIFQNPNSLGITCAIFLPLALCRFLETKKSTTLFFFLLMLIALFLSASRNSINASVIALGYFIYMRSKKHKPIIVFISISFALMLFWSVQTSAKEFFHAYYRSGSISSIGGRIEIWPMVLNLIVEKPFLGHGFGVEEKIIFFKSLALRNQFGGAAVHNSYLGIMLQLGIIGFIIFFIPLFILLFKELFSKNKASVSILRHALRASFIAGLLCSIFESWVYSVGNAQVFPFWIMVMLLVFYRYQEEEKPSPDGT